MKPRLALGIIGLRQQILGQGSCLARREPSSASNGTAVEVYHDLHAHNRVVWAATDVSANLHVDAVGCEWRSQK